MESFIYIPLDEITVSCLSPTFNFPLGSGNPFHTHFKQYIPLATKNPNLPSITVYALQRHARLGILVLKLHVNAIQSPVHYYQIYKKNFLVVMGIEPGTYVMNYNISVTLP